MDNKNKKTGEELARILAILIVFMIMSTFIGLWIKFFWLGFVLK